IDVQESLQRELIVNTYLHSSTVQLIKKAPRFFSIIEPILEKNGIPDDFKYVAVIESNLNPRAVSPAKAVGLWQFLEGTGKEYKLEINSDVDERYNVEKSTEAACAFIKSLYNRFGSWTAAAAAYNMGGGGLNNQMKNQNETNYYSLLLSEETERYVFRILALKQIMTHPRTYNFDIKDTYPIEETKKVKVTQSIDNLAAFARQQGISYKTLKRFNPWLRKTSLKVNRGKSYEIDIPIKPELYR
ncbi:MAG: lytic transglycosylase domain-containing protein, partial [Odoribacter sp.]|nr:lytic transglycosylase domain-containing protein [Odoribacter sp.]